jgi:prolyl-tRNA synthetase
MGPELMRLTDRSDREFVLGPTHEEIVTALVAGEVKSYRELPYNFYQIQTKFRDEIRPRFGIMRAREFIMKDAYSFDKNEEDLNKSYWIMYEAYEKIFERCGLKTVAVEADTGAMGGNVSHEFMALADTGEACIATCDKCGKASNQEIASVRKPAGTPPAEKIPAIESKDTPNKHTVEEVTEFLNVSPESLIKTLIYIKSDGSPFAVMVRGDNDVNEIKVARLLGEPVELASPDVILKVTGAPVGFAGPVGMAEKIPLLADNHIRLMGGSVTGANKNDVHFVNVLPGRDFEPDKWGDLIIANEGMGCASCKDGNLKLSRGIEVGQVFKLGTKYSKSLGALYTDESGQEKPMVMGCYGIGVTRTAAAVIEQHNDKDGIIWPPEVAPFDVYVMALDVRVPEITETSEEICKELSSKGLDILYDDRDERPGVKFKDADLLGVPFRIAIGSKSLKDGCIELKIRDKDGVEKIPSHQAIKQILNLKCFTLKS